MADFKEMIKILARICKKYPYCVGCPINELRQRNGDRLECLPAIAENHEKAESIILKWAEENPMITNGDKLEEIFGFKITLSTCQGVDCPHFNDGVPCNKCEFKNFWEQEYKESDKED